MNQISLAELIILFLFAFLGLANLAFNRFHSSSFRPSFFQKSFFGLFFSSFFSQAD